MNYHIVRMNEKIEKIANNYNLTVEEIKVLNQHISNWDNIIAGTKLILPNIPERIKDELNDVEPFIEEYYPKISDLQFDTYADNKPQINNEKKKDEDLLSQEKNKPQESKHKHYVHPKFYSGYYPPYAPYYPYYAPYDTRRVSRGLNKRA